ncbi:GPI-anchored CFEM domain protein A-like [Setaria italica]|uniref:GPI-anchored CFEM domain protein A-like n=1 Tax=Setaria italica TaxID=4555 RepID=UPI000645A6F6|nr:GPI-anchored CFEM domain protein A-like [Setaria italica]
MKRGLCGSSQDIQRTVGPPHALGSRLSGTRAREDSPTSPDAAVSIIAAGAGATISATATVYVVATEADATVSATAAISVIAAGAGATVSTTAAVSVVVATSATDASDTGASLTGSSSASSSRFISSLDGGTPGAASGPAGLAAGAEGGTGVGPCSVPDYGTLSSITVVEAASAGGTVAPPTTPPLAPGGVMVGPVEAADARSAFFGASGRTKFRGAALRDDDNFIKNSPTLRKE